MNMTARRRSMVTEGEKGYESRFQARQGQHGHGRGKTRRIQRRPETWRLQRVHPLQMRLREGIHIFRQGFQPPSLFLRLHQGTQWPECDDRGDEKARQRHQKAQQVKQALGQGAYFEEKSNRWRADLYYQGKNIHLGRYADKLDAIKAKLENDKKYHDKVKGEMKKIN